MFSCFHGVSNCIIQISNLQKLIETNELYRYGKAVMIVINVKKLNSCLKRGVNWPDSTYTTAKMIYQEYSH